MLLPKTYCHMHRGFQAGVSLRRISKPISYIKTEWAKALQHFWIHSSVNILAD